MGLVWVLVIIVVVALVGIAGWAFKVATSDVKGRGDAQVIKNSAVNRIGQQEGFEDRYAEVKSADEKIDVLAEAAKKDPKDIIASTNLTGAKSYCIQVSAEYNAQARKFTAAQFRAEDLPYEIDKANPATDCKETESK